jgi:hypothetical protein
MGLSEVGREEFGGYISTGQIEELSVRRACDFCFLPPGKFGLTV